MLQLDKVKVVEVLLHAFISLLDFFNTCLSMIFNMASWLLVQCNQNLKLKNCSKYFL